MSQPLELNEYRARARAAADYGKQGYFVTSLIEVADRDVPELCDEIERLRMLVDDLTLDRTFTETNGAEA